MLANAARSYLHRYAVLPGQQAVVFTNAYITHIHSAGFFRLRVLL